MASLTIDVQLANGLRGRLPAALDIALEAGPGITRIAGPSGAGKSTLLAAIAGVVPIAKGRIRQGDHVWNDVAARIHVLPEARGIGWCPQGGALFPHLTAAANIRYGQRGNDARFRSLVDGLEIALLLERPARVLSGGEASRVALARALYTQTSDAGLLLLDEPYAALDAALRKRVGTFVSEEVRRLGCIALVVEHTAEDAGPQARALSPDATYNMRHAFREYD